MSEIMETHLPCSACGSSDAVTLYDDGHTFCFSCEDYQRGNSSPLQAAKKKKKPVDCIAECDMETKPLTKRGIKAETCKKYGYFMGHDEYGNAVQIANYYNNDGELIFQKSRDADKNMFIRGKEKPIFFGQHLFKGGGKKLIITEGEIDCLTMSQVNGNKYPVVSVPSGCKSAVKTFKANLKWLESFEEVIVMFDMDEPGREAAKSVGGILSPHKLKIASLELKDPNEMLQAGKVAELINSVFRAEEYRPDGIVNANELKDKLFEDNGLLDSYDYPWNPSLNKMTLGMRRDELVLWTAGSGIGKSTACREIAYKLTQKDKLKVGMVMLEEKTTKTVRDILSIHMGMPLHKLWKDEDVRKSAAAVYDDLFESGQFVLYDHFGALDSDNLINQIRYMIVGEGCDFVILDHITIAVSGMDTDKGDVKATDILMTRLRSLVDETNAGIIMVSHLRKVGQGNNSFEEGGLISMDDLRGSGALKQLSDTIIALERNQQAEDEEDKNVVRMRVLKCRFTGETGLTKDPLEWSKENNRLQEIECVTHIKEDNTTGESPF